MTSSPTPCRFCAGKAFPEPPSLGRSHWNVICDDCGASGPHGHDEGQAIRRWNKSAQGIEAGTAETVQQGSVHESPVAESDAPKDHPNDHRQTRSIHND